MLQAAGAAPDRGDAKRGQQQAAGAGAAGAAAARAPSPAGVPLFARGVPQHYKPPSEAVRDQADLWKLSAEDRANLHWYVYCHWLDRLVLLAHFTPSCRYWTLRAREAVIAVSKQHPISRSSFVTYLPATVVCAQQLPATINRYAALQRQLDDFRRNTDAKIMR